MVWGCKGKLASLNKSDSYYLESVMSVSGTIGMISRTPLALSRVRGCLCNFFEELNFSKHSLSLIIFSFVGALNDIVSD
jgi:hypothetical protein